MLLLMTTGVSARETVGFLEKVAIYPGALEINAKVDSGATNSSLNCACSEVIKKDNTDWVRFTVVNDKGESTTLEKKLVRYAKVKRHFAESQRRPVIQLGICMAGVYRDVEVNLVSRKGYKYQMLIGRSFMRKDFLIAPDKTFLTTPACLHKK
jgi:hypothetical protein